MNPVPDGISASARETTGRPCILVVEDDVDSQNFMRVILGRRFDVEVCRSGVETRAALEERGSDVALVIMDISLSGPEDGLTLTRVLRNDGRWSHLPIVVVTAHAFDADREAALEAGCTRFVTKPFDRHDLLSLVDELVEEGCHSAGAGPV